MYTLCPSLQLDLGSAFVRHAKTSAEARVRAAKAKEKTQPPATDKQKPLTAGVQKPSPPKPIPPKSSPPRPSHHHQIHHHGSGQSESRASASVPPRHRQGNNQQQNNQHQHQQSRNNRTANRGHSRSKVAAGKNGSAPVINTGGNNGYGGPPVVEEEEDDLSPVDMSQVSVS